LRPHLAREVVFECLLGGGVQAAGAATAVVVVIETGWLVLLVHTEKGENRAHRLLRIVA
jgi:hypothetical protein